MGRFCVAQDGEVAQDDKTFEAVDEIGHSDLGRRSSDPEGADE